MRTMTNAAITAERIARARQRKAAALVSVLRSVGCTTADLDAIDWTTATKAAGVNPPSDDTIELVRSLMTMLEAHEAKHPDPFEGL